MKLLLIILICYYSTFVEVSFAQYKIEIFSTEVTGSQVSSIYSSNSEYKLVGGAGQSAVSSFSGYFRSLQGSGFLTHVELIDPVFPNSFILFQNYPNPFNPTTKIKFSLPHEGDVKLEVFNLLGEKIATLVDEYLSTGNYESDFNAEKLSSGIYLYKLSAGGFVKSRKMMLVK